LSPLRDRGEHLPESVWTSLPEEPSRYRNGGPNHIWGRDLPRSTGGVRRRQPFGWAVRGRRGNDVLLEQPVRELARHVHPPEGRQDVVHGSIEHLHRVVWRSLSASLDDGGCSPANNTPAAMTAHRFRAARDSSSSRKSVIKRLAPRRRIDSQGPALGGTSERRAQRSGCYVGLGSLMVTVPWAAPTRRSPFMASMRTTAVRSC